MPAETSRCNNRHARRADCAARSGRRHGSWYVLLPAALLIAALVLPLAAGCTGETPKPPRPRGTLGSQNVKMDELLVSSMHMLRNAEEYNIVEMEEETGRLLATVSLEHQPYLDNGLISPALHDELTRAGLDTTNLVGASPMAGGNRWLLIDKDRKAVLALRRQPELINVHVEGIPRKFKVYQFNTPRTLDVVVDRLNEWVQGEAPLEDWQRDPMLDDLPRSLTNDATVFHLLGHLDARSFFVHAELYLHDG